MVMSWRPIVLARNPCSLITRESPCAGAACMTGWWYNYSSGDPADRPPTQSLRNHHISPAAYGDECPYTLGAPPYSEHCTNIVAPSVAGSSSTTLPSSTLVKPVDTIFQPYFTTSSSSFGTVRFTADFTIVMAAVARVAAVLGPWRAVGGAWQATGERPGPLGERPMRAV